MLTILFYIAISLLGLAMLGEALDASARKKSLKQAAEHREKMRQDAEK